MLRPVLLGLLVVSASSCGKSTTESSAAKAQPGVSAGKVLEVKGAVTVKHGPDTKPLAVGDSVEGEDTVITGADGNVVIELAHNSARWELGANKSQRVRDSIAWNAKKATAQEIDQATAAAGRPAERSAAGTVAMEGEAAMAEAPPAAAPAPAPAPPKADDDMTSKGDAPKAPPRRRMASKSAAPSPAPEAAMAPAPPPPPPPAPEPTDDEFRPARTRGPIAKAAPPPKTESAAATAAAPPGPSGGAAAPPPTPTQQLRASSDALKKCMTDHGAKDEIMLVVDVSGGKGTAKITSKSAVSAALDQCMAGVVSGISFVLSGKGTLVLKP
jgi:hypothetical protein